MRIEGIDFPKQMLNALRDNKLVIFAGAGVSRGEPASLPLFNELAQAIANGTGESLQCGEAVDQFLGKLKRRNNVDVHSIAAAKLRKNCLGKVPEPTRLHRDLLRLFPQSASPLIVTTNFDLLFETATDDLFDAKPEVYRAPALPLGRRFEGIVHLHGTLDRPHDMILTDADFGRAYLTEGWARRFLVELFRTFTVLFVGYSHRDTIMEYLAKALPVNDEKGRFALTDEIDPRRWRYLGIEPIPYPELPDDPHVALYDGVHGLANHARRSILDWKREITEFAEKPPTLDEEAIDVIKDALTDESKTRFFTDAATSVEWVAWLDERNYLDRLFGSGELRERDDLFANWLAGKFLCEHPDELFLLIGRHHMQVNPAFWRHLCRNIESCEDAKLDCGILSRWVSLLLATAPAQLETEHPLFWLGKRCIKNNLLDRVVDVFDAMAASRVVVKRGFSWPVSDEEEQSPRMDIECAPVSDHHTINELWTKGLRPNLDLVAEPLLATVIGRLTKQHRTLSAWQKANRDSNPVSYNRSAIEPHEQDEQDGYPKTIDVLIDAARNCLEWLASNQPKKAVRWCDRLASEESPLLRRLAVHALSSRNDLNSSEKIGWLLAYMDLYDHAAHHELFVCLRKTYPKADQRQRMAVINAVQAYRAPIQEDEDTETKTAYRHFTWLDWLHKSAPECPFAEEALHDVLSRFPEFQPSERPDFTHWMSSVPGGHQSPWTVDELLSKPAEEWADELLSFQDTGINEPDRFGLNIAVSEAAKRDFQWGLDLADALAKRRKWATDLWNTLMRLWSESELDQNRVRQVIQQLERTELQKNCARPIAEFLYNLVTNDNTQHDLIPLTQVNQIAANLWRRHIDREDARREIGSWLTAAINTTAGLLAGFWLHSLNCWRKRQAGESDNLSPEYRDALSEIVENKTLAGRLGRAVLARYLSFLVGVDRDWTEANLVPLFTNHTNVEDYQAIWDGFLYGRLSPAVAELVGEAFLDAVSRIEQDFSGEGQKQLISHYIEMLANFADDPLEVWIPEFFNHAGDYARRYFAITIGNRLEQLTDSQQREWWEHWVRQYWTNRLNRVPKDLDAGEVELMLRWLPNLKAVFVEAVDLAVQMPTKNAKHDGEMLYRLIESDQCENQPESVAKLLIFLEHVNSESFARKKERELIGILREADIADWLRLKLEELATRRGYT